MMTETVQETDLIPSATVRQSVSIPIFEGIGQFITFNQLVDGREHIAILFKAPNLAGKALETPLVRVHSECLTGDVFGSGRCDCGEQLQEAIRTIAKTGGVLLYLRQEGRGIGLYSKLDAYSLQDLGHDTFDANRLLGLEEDARDYTVAFQMLEALGIQKIRLLSNNPEKARQLESHGIEIQELVSTRTYTKLHNVKYLLAKATKGGHKIDLQALRPAGVEA